MRDTIVKNWNRVVKPDDIIWHLGDVSLGTIEETTSFVSQLSGRKRLIMGNHDHRICPENWEKIGFELVLSGAKIRHGKNSINLSHYPYSPGWKDILKAWYKKYDMRQLRNRFKNDGSWLVHGHTHNTWGKTRDKMINVSTDVWDFTPVSYKKILQIIAKGGSL